MCLGFVVGFFCCCEAFWFVGFLCVGFFFGLFLFFFSLEGEGRGDAFSFAAGGFLCMP